MKVTSHSVHVVEALALGIALVLCTASCSRSVSRADEATAAAVWQEDFGLAGRSLGPTGRSTFFVLEPGFRIVLASKTERVAITVLDDTVLVDGVQTRVVEEREWKDARLVEVSRNYFAICADTKDVFYFGEEVDEYRNDKVTGHSGAWRAGRSSARAGLMMPGKPAVGMKYYQEIAPGVAMDRAEVVSLSETTRTPGGVLYGCLKTCEGPGLDPKEQEFKVYAPGVGMVQDGELVVVEYGEVRK